MKSLVLFPILALALTACGPSEQDAQKAYDNQLAAAKAEGIPLSAKDLTDQIPTVADAQNAALQYQTITQKKLLRPIPEDISDILKAAAHPQTMNQAKAEEVLKPFSEGLGLLTLGSVKPGCNFNRDWELGSAVLMPEYAELKGGVRLLSLRAALSAAKGDHEAAVRDLRAINSIANQIASEPLFIPRLVANALQTIGAQRTVDLAIAYPDQELYALQLNEYVIKWPIRDAQKEYTNEFEFLIVFLDHAEDKSYYVDAMGMPESELGKLTTGSKAAQLQAKAEIIKHYRAAVAALALPQNECDKQFLAATEAVDRTLSTFPTLKNIYTSLSMGDYNTSSRNIGPTQKLLYTAAQRALKSRNTDGSFPITITVSDLKTPIDALPIEYKSDGKSFTVTANIPAAKGIGGEEPPSLTFPRTTH